MIITLWENLAVCLDRRFSLSDSVFLTLPQLKPLAYAEMSQAMSYNSSSLWLSALFTAMQSYHCSIPNLLKYIRENLRAKETIENF